MTLGHQHTHNTASCYTGDISDMIDTNATNSHTVQLSSTSSLRPCPATPMPAVLRFANDLARTVELNRRTAPVSERVERKVATA